LRQKFNAPFYGSNVERPLNLVKLQITVFYE
jgi:hypothetical protein